MAPDRVSNPDPLYAGHGVEVTAEIVRSAGGRAIPLSEVAACHVETLRGSRAPGIAVAVAGVLVGGLCLATGSEAEMLGLLFGASALAIGFLMAVMAHPRYLVRLEMRGGKRRLVLGTADEAAAREVAAAIQAARGVEMAVIE